MSKYNGIPDARKYERLVDAKEIPLLKRLKIRILDLLGDYGVEAYTIDLGLGPLRYFYDYCRKHKTFYIAYEHGSSNLRPCPICDKE